MNKLKRSSAAKAVAIVLLSVCIPMVLGSSLCAAVLAQYGVYSASSLADTDLLSGILTFDVDTLGEEKLYTSESAQRDFRMEFGREWCSTIVTVTDPEGQTVLVNYSAVPAEETTAKYTLSYAYTPTHEWVYAISEGHNTPASLSYRQKLDRPLNLSFVDWLLEEKGVNTYGMTGSDVYDCYNEAFWAEYITFRTTEEVSLPYEGYYNITLALDSQSVSFLSEESIIINGFGLRGVFVGLAIGGFVLGLGLFIFLCCAAGWRREGDRPTGSWLERTPLELFLAGSAMAMLFFWFVAEDSMDSAWFDQPVMNIILFILGVLGLSACCVGTVHSLIARFKCGGWWKHTVAYGIWRVVKWVLSNISDLWKVLLCAALWKTINIILIFITIDRLEAGIILVTLVDVAVIGFIAFIVLQWQKLRRAASAIADGQSNVRVDTGRMLPPLRAHGEDINRMGQGVATAVEEQLKSERMKTDLITNVSHDLKTPLTSIVSYVGLLKNETVENETARGYIDTLDRQAVRLGRLIEDLVEASKVTSGSITPRLVPVNVGELLEQAVCEYESRLESSSLSPVLTVHQSRLTASADGRLLWRVFDNLLSNACKYAMPGTRLYIDAFEQGGRVGVSFRNISAQPLNIPADELLERFVRGDSSRTTSGSGLGLTIASSLVELQNGTFALDIDGDLFKAHLTLPVAEDTQPEEGCAESCEPVCAENGDDLPETEAPAAPEVPEAPEWDEPDEYTTEYSEYSEYTDSAENVQPNG